MAGRTGNDQPDWLEHAERLDEDHLVVVVKKKNGSKVVYQIPSRPLFDPDPEDELRLVRD